MTTPTPAVPDRRLTSESPFSGLESWVTAHSSWLALGVLALAFAARFHAAWGTFLNPDEALHFGLANQLSLAAAYRASLTSAHPPGLVFVLYFWRLFGTSEILLRLPSIIAGSAFCWFIFKWITKVFGAAAGWVGLILASFLPPMIELSSEVRQYALLLLFISCALYFLELAFDVNSAALMLPSATALYFAMLSHYSAFLFAAAFYAYGFARLLTSRSSRNLWLAVLSSACAAFALFSFFYRTHLAKLAKTPMAAEAIQGWMRNSYCHPGQDNPLLFSFFKTGGVFQYVFGQRALGDVAYLCFLIAIVLLLNRRKPGTKAEPWPIALLLVLPFAINAAAAIIGAYPYGGTRHSAYLALFAYAGISFFIARMFHHRMVPSVICAVVLVIISFAFATRQNPYITRSDQSRSHMLDAIAYIRRQVPPDQLIFADYESGLLLSDYLCEHKTVAITHPGPGLEKFTCASEHVLAAFPPGPMIFAADNFKENWEKFARTSGVEPGQSIWLVQAGWAISPVRQLVENNSVSYNGASPALRLDESHSFGSGIEISRLTVVSR